MIPATTGPVLIPILRLRESERDLRSAQDSLYRCNVSIISKAKSIILQNMLV